MHFYTVLTCFSCCTHVLTRKKRRAVPRRIAWGPPACTFTQFLICRCMFVSFAAPALRPSMLHVRRCMFLSCVVRRFPLTLDVRRCMFLSFAARPCGWLALVLRRGVRCRTFVVACSCPSPHSLDVTMRRSMCVVACSCRVSFAVFLRRSPCVLTCSRSSLHVRVLRCSAVEAFDAPRALLHVPVACCSSVESFDVRRASLLVPLSR